MRSRYQNGSLTTEERAKGAVWVYRWREVGFDGKRVQRKIIIGSLKQYPSQSAAWKAVEGLQLLVNEETPKSRVDSITVDALVRHYRQKELVIGDDAKATSTVAAYECYLENWILPRWKHYRLKDVKRVLVAEWLAQLPLANGSRAKIRNIMHALFNHAIRYEWLGANPITLIRQSAKRQRIPVPLDAGEIASLVGELGQRERAMLFLDAATGLRRSELRGLKWKDVNFETLELSVERSIVGKAVGKCKTEVSKKPVPLHPALTDELWLWKQASSFTSPEDWIWGSPATGGERPLWPENLLRRYIRPAAERAGIKKPIGFHCFRHSLSTLLKANGEDVKVVQELLRHANSRITLDTYTQAVTPAKREAQDKVVRAIQAARGQAGQERG